MRLEQLTISCAGQFTSTRVHAEKETLGMQIVRYCSHSTRKLLLVCNELALAITAIGPAVV
jgi:hypothetical protein